MAEDKISVYTKNVISNYNDAKNYVNQNPQIVAGSLRASLENAVKLFWAVRFNKEWTKGEAFNLYSAITDPRFSAYFSKIQLSDMHLIREMCNGVLHGESTMTVDEAKELISRLEKCISVVWALM